MRTNSDLATARVWYAKRRTLQRSAVDLRSRRRRARLELRSGLGRDSAGCLRPAPCWRALPRRSSDARRATRLLVSPRRSTDLRQLQGKLSKKSRVPSVEIAYAKFEHPQERAAIVLVTGRTESYLKYAELIRDIVERNADLGYSLYILDHRGQGFSTRLLPDEPQKGYVEDFDNYVADLDTFLRTVVHPERHRRVFALAHSLGGGITARYLQDYQPTTDAFDAAILTSPMLGIAAVDGKERNLVGRAVEGASLALARGLVALGRGTWYLTDRDYDPDWGVWSCSAADGAPRRCDEGEGEGNSLTHSLTRHEMHRWLRLYEPRIQLGGATARWLVESYAATQTMRDAGRSSGIEIPVLVLQAELESIVSNPDQRAVCAAMPNCRLEVVPRASHEPIFEVDEIRSLYLNRLVTFFEAHLDG